MYDAQHRLESEPARGIALFEGINSAWVCQKGFYSMLDEPDRLKAAHELRTSGRLNGARRRTVRRSQTRGVGVGIFVIGRGYLRNRSSGSDTTSTGCPDAAEDHPCNGSYAASPANQRIFLGIEDGRSEQLMRRR
jgi:hypothetical protein